MKSRRIQRNLGPRKTAKHGNLTLNLNPASGQVRKRKLSVDKEEMYKKIGDFQEVLKGVALVTEGVKKLKLEDGFEAEAILQQKKLFGDK